MHRLGVGVMIVTVAALLGCGPTISFVPTNGPPKGLAPRAAGGVEVFVSQRPGRDYQEVGLLHADGGQFTSRGELVAALRGEAARIGCSGVIITGSGEKVSGVSVQQTGNMSTASAHHIKQYTAVCIVYR